MNLVFPNSARVAGPDFLLRRGGRLKRRLLCVRFGFFVHPQVGPVLIDTGYTRRVTTDPGRSFWLRCYAAALRPRLNHTEQAVEVLARFGYSPKDVARVIVTHFHADHVSGLDDYPNAQFLVSRTALEALRSSSRFEAVRHGVFPELLPDDFELRLREVERLDLQPLQNLPAGYDLFGDATVYAVPLPGHAPGHLGVLFAQVDPPLLYATDTQWVMEGLAEQNQPYLLPRLIADDPVAAKNSSELVSQFQRQGGRVILCHDDAATPFDLKTRGDE